MNEHALVTGDFKEGTLYVRLRQPGPEGVVRTKELEYVNVFVDLDAVGEPLGIELNFLYGEPGHEEG